MSTVTRKASFTVQYRGEPLVFAPVISGDKMIGYSYRHPQRGEKQCRWNWVDTESGTRHVLTFDEQGRATIKSSLACPQGCGWHVVIEGGVCRDA